MIQAFLAVLALPIILQVVAGEAVASCGKLRGTSTFCPNNMYSVVLKQNHTDEDANRIIKAVDEYQSSLEKNGTEDAQSQIRSQLIYLRNVNQLIGSLTEEAVLLVCTYMSFSLLYTHSYVYMHQVQVQGVQYRK